MLSRSHLLAALCLAMLVVFLLWPMALTLSGGFTDTAGGGSARPTLGHLGDVLRDPVLREGLVNSFFIAVCVTFGCVVVATPLAGIVTGYEFRGRTVLAALLLAPLVLPPFVGVIGLRQLLGQYGAVNAALASIGIIDASHPVDFLGGGGTWTIPWTVWSIDGRAIGVIVMEVLHLYPIVYLNAAAALGSIDPTLGQAAENLGASRWQRMRRVTLPLVLPGLFAGGAIAFIGSLTELGTPLMFDYYNVTPVQLFYAVQEAESSPRPYALVAVLLTLAVVVYALSRWALGGHAGAMSTRGAMGASPKHLREGRALLAAIPMAVVAAGALLPHLGVVLTSFAAPGSWYRSVLPPSWTTEHYVQALTHPLAAGAIRNSLFYASGAVAIDLVLGVAVAWLVVRARVKASWLLDALAMLPLAVPGLVLAFGYVAVSIQIKGWYSRAGHSAPSIFLVLGESPNPALFLMIAYGVRRLPYIVRSAAAGLQQSSAELEDAARNLGAGPLYTLRRVTAPLILVHLIAGAMLAFSLAMLEVSDSLILAQREEDYPLTKSIFTLYERLGDGPHVASALGVWGMLLLTATLVGASMMLGRKSGALFRM